MDGAGGGYPADPRIHAAHRESGRSPGRYRAKFLCSSPSRCWRPARIYVAVGHIKRGGRLASKADHCTPRNSGKTDCRRADFQRVSLSRRLAFYARCEADHTTFGKSCENLNCLTYEYSKAM